MTIDERLEALAERHEALALSLELLSHEVESLRAATQNLLATTREHTKQLEMDGEHIRALVRIAEIHDRRITDIEGVPPQ